jgi:hypothetical protein
MPDIPAGRFGSSSSCSRWAAGDTQLSSSSRSMTAMGWTWCLKRALAPEEPFHVFLVTGFTGKWLPQTTMRRSAKVLQGLHRIRP